MQAIIFYFQLFTRIPINKEIPEADKVYQNGIHWFWVFGVVFSGIVTAFYCVYAMLFPVSVAWLLVILTENMLTGAFHHDALADTCDGVFSARTKERMLEIMKDSRIGTNGVIALIFYYLMMVVMGNQLMDPAKPIRNSLIVFATVLIARFGLQFNFWNFKYSGHTQGLGTINVGISNGKVAVSLAIMTLIIGVCLSVPGVIGVAVVMLGMWVYRTYIYRVLGGMSGDTVGASALLSQLLFLLALLACYRLGVA